LTRRSPTAPAVAISALGIVVPFGLTIGIRSFAEGDYGPLIWLVALVPVFTMAYYRGLRGGSVSSGVGMSALAAALIIVSGFGLATVNWTGFVVVAIAYAILSSAVSVFAELLRQEQQQAEQLALSDQLTGLPNRRHGEEFLDREFSAAMRGRMLAVVLWDLDHFKQFNDRHGHAAGDEVLRIFSGVLQKHTRHHNLSARYGGEEFISIVTDVNAEGMLIFANKVLDDLRAAPSAWGTITSSAGIAEFRKGMGSYEVLVASADRALYAAKEAGRDRIKVMGELETRASQPRLSLAMPAHQQRVLVVDDDPNVRRALVEALEGEGFAVESTASAVDASQMLYGGPESIDLLVTSLMLPRVSGFTLVDQLQDTTPDLRVVYLSENMRENVSWRGVPGTVTRFVSKPVDPKKLVAAAKEALAEELEEDDMAS